MLRAVEAASALDNHAYAKQPLAQIDGAKAQLYREYEVVSDRYGNAQTLLAYYRDLTEQIKGRRYLTAEQAHTGALTQP
jgi:conjugative transfer pilus assembly protein TraH